MEWYKDGMYPEWSLTGDSFSPRQLREQYPELVFATQHEKEDISGRGEPYSFGSCSIVVEEQIDNKLDWLLTFIEKEGDSIRELGVTDELLWIVWWGRQGNMELSAKELKRMAATGLNLAMDYYYIDK